MFLVPAETAREWLTSTRVAVIDPPAPRSRRGRRIAQDLRALVHAHAAAERRVLIC
jgi:hypothetical protein